MLLFIFFNLQTPFCCQCCYRVRCSCCYCSVLSRDEQRCRLVQLSQCICKMVVVFELLFVELKAMRTLDNREMCCVYCSESACSLNSDGMDGQRIKREQISNEPYVSFKLSDTSSSTFDIPHNEATCCSSHELLYLRPF